MTNTTITLSSDFSPNSPYLSLIRHFLNRKRPAHCNLLDFIHTGYQFDMMEVSLFIRHNFKYFEEGNTHLILCDIYENYEGFFLLGQIRGQWFVAPNNGILTLIYPVLEWEVMKKIPLDTVAKVNHMTILDALFPYLANPKAYEQLPDLALQEWKSHELPLPVLTTHSIRGNFISIDGFGNAISNIDQSLFEQKAKSHTKFRINVGLSKLDEDPYVLDCITPHYNAQKDGNPIALFNSMNLLEIAIRHGNAARLLGLKTMYEKRPDRSYFHDSISVEFS